MQNPSSNQFDPVSAPQFRSEMYAVSGTSGSPLKWMLLGAAMGVLGFGALFGLYESHRAKADAIPPQAAQAPVDDKAAPVEANAAADRPLVRVVLKDGQELLVDEVRNNEGNKETSLVIHIPKTEIATVGPLALDEADEEAKAEDQVAQANQAAQPNNAQAKPDPLADKPIRRSGNTGYIGRHFVASDWVNDVAARQRRQELRTRNFMLPMKRYLESYRNGLRRAGLKVPKELDRLIDGDPQGEPAPAVKPAAPAKPT